MSLYHILCTKYIHKRLINADWSAVWRTFLDMNLVTTLVLILHNWSPSHIHSHSRTNSHSYSHCTLTYTHTHTHNTHLLCTLTYTHTSLHTHTHTLTTHTHTHTHTHNTHSLTHTLTGREYIPYPSTYPSSASVSTKMNRCMWSFKQVKILRRGASSHTRNEASSVQ